MSPSQSPAATLKGDHAAERAALILSLIAGVQIMRQTIGLAPLARTAPATLQHLLAPLIQQLADGPPATPGRKPPTSRI